MAEFERSDEGDKLRMAEAELLVWAKRTVFFAIFLRGEEEGQPVVDEQAQIRQAQKATEKVVAELWEQLSKEVPGDESYKFFVFARKVLDWCEEHRRRESEF